jgi:hypothetical protein
MAGSCSAGRVGESGDAIRRPCQQSHALLTVYMALFHKANKGYTTEQLHDFNRRLACAGWRTSAPSQALAQRPGRCAAAGAGGGISSAPQVPSVVTANGALHAMQRVLSSGWQTAQLPCTTWHANCAARAQRPGQRRARLQASPWLPALPQGAAQRSVQIEAPRVHGAPTARAACTRAPARPCAPSMSSHSRTAPVPARASERRRTSRTGAGTGEQRMTRARGGEGGGRRGGGRRGRGAPGRIC